MSYIQISPAENLTALSGIYLWGLEVIRVIQKIESPALTVLIKFITALGTEKLYLPVILFIFWCIDEKRGLRLGILIIVSAWINSFLKDILKQPRPFNLDPFLGLAYEPSYGAPSGHAQMSLCFWIPMTVWLAKSLTAGKLMEKVLTAKIFTTKIWEGKEQYVRCFLSWAPAIIMILLIGFSRLYLGVHFPTDLLAGWLLGGIVLVVWFIPGPFFMQQIASSGFRAQNICAAAAALVMNGLCPGDRSLPAVFLGFCLGYNIMRRYFPFFAQGGFNGKKLQICIFRCLAGFAGMTIIYAALQLILPGEWSLFRDLPLWGQTSPFYDLGRFLRYGLLGLWVTAGAPMVFQRLELASIEGGAERRGENRRSEES